MQTSYNLASVEYSYAQELSSVKYNFKVSHAYLCLGYCNDPKLLILIISVFVFPYKIISTKTKHQDGISPPLATTA